MLCSGNVQGQYLPVTPASRKQDDTIIGTRDLSELTRTRFDLVIVGGGIQGAWSAWDAALRGLSVALVEQADFGAATSANSLKVIHGGLRYLKRADLPRVWRSIRERAALLRVAADLVHPLPCLVPLNGSVGEKTALWGALKLADAIGFDRNRGADPDHRIPGGRMLSRAECLELAPFLDSARLAGAALWYDCQIRSPERLVLSLALAAADRGAAVLNYARARKLVLQGGKVVGVMVSDGVSGEEALVRARVVLDATGPWSGELLRTSAGAASAEPHALGVNLVYRGRLAEVAVGLRMRTDRHRDPIGGGDRFLFLAPWRNSTLIGTAYRPFSGSVDRLDVSRNDLLQLLQDVNEACPALQLAPERVTHFHCGLLPLQAGVKRSAGGLAHCDRLIDHARIGGPPGLVSATGVKYTTARRLAERSVDLVVSKLGLSRRRCHTDAVPLPAQRLVPDLDPDDLPALVAHAVNAEMAVHLSDLVMRRSELGNEQCPGPEQLAALAGAMAAHLNWRRERVEAELESVRHAYAPLDSLRQEVAA